jgi:hypothetical protein
VPSGEALELYRTHYVAMTAAFVMTIASHVAYYLTNFCAEQSLHNTVRRTASLVDVMSIMPLVNMITSLPISFGGVGVRETLFQELLGNLAHVSTAITAFSASVGFAIQASWGLCGAATYLLLLERSDYNCN